MTISTPFDVILLFVLVVLQVFDSFVQGAIRFAKVCVFVALVAAFVKRLSRKAYMRLAQRLLQQFIKICHISQIVGKNTELLRAQS